MMGIQAMATISATGTATAVGKWQHEHQVEAGRRLELDSIDSDVLDQNLEVLK